MLLLIDKPKGMTSHDVVDEVRKITGKRRVGHAGTLDPNAEGLLIVGVGRESTKKLGKIAKGTTKTYEAEIELGVETDTGDAGRRTIKKFQNSKIPKLQEIKKILKEFTGEQEQVPPAYSAIKVGGKKAYQLARRGRKVKLEPRKVVIHSIELLDFSYPLLKIRTEVSAGTYIRALARDIGRKLTTGAYLKNLKRTKIGKFSLKNAHKLDKLKKGNWST